MFNFISTVSHLAASLGLIVTSFIGHAQLVPHVNISATPQPTVAVQHSENSPMLTLNKSINYMGYSVNMSASVPENGGTLTGTISGSCLGTITGHFDGNNKGIISGLSNINCKVGPIQIPGTATFTGTVNKITNSAQLLLNYHIGSMNNSQNVVVNFN